MTKDILKRIDKRFADYKMGIIRFVGSLARFSNDIIVSARPKSYSHIYIDFNSIVHTSSKIIIDRLKIIQ